MIHAPRSVVAALVVSLAAIGNTATAQQGAPETQNQPSIEAARTSIEQRLAESLKELSALRAGISDERLPLAEQLSQLEAQVTEARSEFDEVAAELAEKTQGLNNLRTTIDGLESQTGYLDNLLAKYNEEFAARLHAAELGRYRPQLQQRRARLENQDLPQHERIETHLDTLALSLDRLEDVIGGTRFEGSAVADGIRKSGRFVLVGPSALFQSDDGADIGSVTELPGSEEPIVIGFSNPEDRDAAARLALGTGGAFPADVTLGNAQKVESIEETWWEHVQKGGVIMIPMAVLAGLALLVVLIKWLSLLFVRAPSKRQIKHLMGHIDDNDFDGAQVYAKTMPGPAGRMLQAGAKHLGQPRELIEAVLFEQVLSTRLRLQSWLPFVGICATSAPLLGLLGTVTGIMGTFSLMTEFGTGDPKVLSSGISEALITTETGLIVAIPSLLLHAFLARKVKSLIDGMEKAALQFLNRLHDPIDLDDRVEAISA